jgi:hypothetical protein
MGDAFLIQNIKGDLPLDGSSQAQAAESASAIQQIKPNATNGYYWINQGLGANQHYCVFTNAAGNPIQGGPWVVPVLSNRNSTEFSTNGPSAISTFKNLCAGIGIDTPGRGMESSRTTTEVYGAWLATKRFLWNEHSSFFTGSYGSGGVLTMPILNINGEGGSSSHRTIYNSSFTTHIPPNYTGDRCDANQLFCGWWGGGSAFAGGWASNNDSLPDPEDWGPANGRNTTLGYSGLPTMVIACTYR